jgi:hypothetical protein
VIARYVESVSRLDQEARGVPPESAIWRIAVSGFSLPPHPFLARHAALSIWRPLDDARLKSRSGFKGERMFRPSVTQLF